MEVVSQYGISKSRKYQESPKQNSIGHFIEKRKIQAEVLL